MDLLMGFTVVCFVLGIALSVAGLMLYVNYKIWGEW